MRIVFALVALVAVLFAFDKIPFASKRQPAPATAGQTASKAPPASTAAAPSAAAKLAEAPRPTYVVTRECTRAPWGTMNCKEVSTPKP
ncbi:hypothetical protein PQJ75_24425 [Rhodoplanes sp. TEM]|uniref:Uncharacterized protein n=1 Tax=Rhodoplanes tepidamans TaxID=200616 RepID=A0ABT5JD85_RHOTP|nr:MULTISPECIES: hypothetical protein [Rhodoplanes]MDC7787587.1 hypothetical protein [Rhodoplanes tepidamans]MDC7986888.1 hypothetical protein [Rhodoplanes sp. TEM]MDQ0358015.1 hypothetical protein [Rhodoplanes tepidamans]